MSNISTALDNIFQKYILKCISEMIAWYKSGGKLKGSLSLDLIFGAKPKAKIADSVFTNLFQIPEYAAQLYQALHPGESEIAQEQIQIVTLENVLLNQPYNDLGMLVVAGQDRTAEEKEEEPDHGVTAENQAAEAARLLVLCEAQSTWSVNILIRMLIYWAQTLQEYIVETDQNVYGSRKLTIPQPEFYVIYTGDRKTKPPELRLSEEFHMAGVDLTVRMIYDGKDGDIISQYVEFVRIYKEQRRKYGRSPRTIRETIRICKERNILREYLESRRKEVTEIMMTLFDEETIMNAYTKEIWRDAKEEGQADGINRNKKETALRMARRGYGIDVIADLVDTKASTVQKWLEGECVAVK